MAMQLLLLPGYFNTKRKKSMRLTKHNICNYLLDKGFISFKSVVDGDFSVIQQQGRNVVFKVMRTQNPGLFIKQLVDMSRQNTYLMQKEATCCWLFTNDPDYEPLKEFVTAYYGYDVQTQVLVTEFIQGAANLHDVYMKEGSQPQGYARQIGKILALLHVDIMDKVKENSSLQFFAQQIPWAMQFGEMNPASSFPGTAAPHLFQMVQQDPGFRAAVSKLKEEWQPSCLLHGDVKLANFISTPVDGNENGEEQEPPVKLIDWEIADIGDPCWDIGGAFQAFLGPWVLSFDNQKPYQVEFLPAMKCFDLDHARSSIKAFWDSYKKEKKLDENQAREILLKSTKYTAARLLQTAVESVTMSPHVPPNSARLLQTAHNILANPGEAVNKLLELA